MTAEQFVYWMQGFAELNAEPPTKEQWQSMREHLAMVFVKVTPPLVETAPEEIMHAVEKRRALRRMEELMPVQWPKPVITCSAQPQPETYQQPAFCEPLFPLSC